MSLKTVNYGGKN